MQPMVTAAPFLKLCDNCMACSRADDDEEEGSSSSSGPKFDLMFCADCMKLNAANPRHDFFGNIPRRKKGAKRKLPQKAPTPTEASANSLTNVISPSIIPKEEERDCYIPFTPANPNENEIELSLFSNLIESPQTQPCSRTPPSTPNEKEQVFVQLSISNLSTEIQVLLLESFLTPSSGVLSLHTHLNDSDQRKAKLVEVTFDPIRISLPNMMASLVELGLDASVVTDLEEGYRRPNSSSGDSEKEIRIPCRSSLYVEGICCATEVPIVTSILRDVGVEKVNINITSRMVYVDHFAEDHMASELARALTREGFESTIKKDGGASKRKKRRNSGSTQDPQSSTVSSHLENDVEVTDSQKRCWHKVLPKGLNLNIILSGMFWIISLIGSFDTDR